MSKPIQYDTSSNSPARAPKARRSVRSTATWTRVSVKAPRSVTPSWMRVRARSRRRCRVAASPASASCCSTPPGLDYITAFFGCLYAGAVAVPVYPRIRVAWIVSWRSRKTPHPRPR